MKLEKMITLVQQERCNGDTMSTSVLKNSRVSNPAIFSKNFASGSILSISQKLFDTVYFTLPTTANTCFNNLFMTATKACLPVFPLALKRSYNALQAVLVFMAFMLHM